MLHLLRDLSLRILVLGWIFAVKVPKPPEKGMIFSPEPAVPPREPDLAPSRPAESKRTTRQARRRVKP